MRPMRRTRRKLGTLAAIAALGSLGAGAILAQAQTVTVTVGNLRLRAEGTISPQTLPRRSFAPITLHAHGSLTTLDGSHVPAAKTVELEVDKHIRIDTTGLPACSLGRIRATSPSVALRACGDALLGEGHASAEVAFPEQAPFSSTGRLLVFNGPRVGGYSEQLDYIYVDVPAPTAVIVTVRFSKGSGPYGYDVSATVPRIAGGAGSLTAVQVKLGREWSYRGVRHSYLSAECPAGHFSDRFQLSLADGTVLDGAALSSCQPRG